MNEAESDGVAERQRVAETLDRLRSGVRQRQAELTTVDGESEEQRLRLADLQASEFLQEPICVSPRPVVGPILVFVRKAFFHLFMKWYMRPVVTPSVMAAAVDICTYSGERMLGVRML